jgi:hypothetical protein
VPALQRFFQFADGARKLQLATLQFFHAAAVIFTNFITAFLDQIAFQKEFQFLLFFRRATPDLFDQRCKTHNANLLSRRIAVNDGPVDLQVFNLNTTPLVAQILRHQPAMAKVRFVLAA